MNHSYQCRKFYPSVKNPDLFLTILRLLRDFIWLLLNMILHLISEITDRKTNQIVTDMSPDFKF